MLVHESKLVGSFSDISLLYDSKENLDRIQLRAIGDIEDREDIDPWVMEPLVALETFVEGQPIEKDCASLLVGQLLEKPLQEANVVVAVILAFDDLKVDEPVLVDDGNDSNICGVSKRIVESDVVTGSLPSHDIMQVNLLKGYFVQKVHIEAQIGSICISVA